MLGPCFYHRLPLLLLLVEQVPFLDETCSPVIARCFDAGAPQQLSFYILLAVSKVAESNGSFLPLDHAQQRTVTETGYASSSAHVIIFVDVSVHACIGGQACASPHALLVASAECCTLTHCCSEG